jgi:hypothetical protein
MAKATEVMAVMTQTIDMPDQKSKKATRPKRIATAPEYRQEQAKVRPKVRPAAMPDVNHDSPPSLAIPVPAKKTTRPKRVAPAPEYRREQTTARPTTRSTTLRAVKPDVPPPPVEPGAPALPMTQEQSFDELVRRASAGNKVCLAGLRKLLDEKPEIWRTVGNLSALAEKCWIGLLGNGNKLAEESIPRRLKELKAELAGHHPTPLEKMLIDLIGVTWLAAQHGEISAAGPPGASLQQANFRLRRAESAQRRLLNSVKMLTMVRALVPRSLMPLSAGGHLEKPDA